MNPPVRIPRVAVTLLIFVGLLGCAAAPPIDLSSVYERTDRDFDSAILFRPDDSAEGSPAWTLAPLILLQNGTAGAAPPIVTYEQTDDGWTYRWWDAERTHAQGLHATVGDDGFPIAYEALRDSSGARLLFVDINLEESAATQFGAALRDRRFSVEREREESPAVAVGGLFEPGPTPLGPFVYLWEETHDINVVLCRCMPARVFDIVDSVAYTLIPYDPTTAPSGLATPPPVATALRLPTP